MLLLLPSSFSIFIPESVHGTETSNLEVTKNRTYPGDIVNFSAITYPDTAIDVRLSWPNGIIENYTTLMSDQHGHFYSSIQLPYNAMSGIWRVLMSSGGDKFGFEIIVDSREKNCCLQANETILESPIKQFKTGILASDVKCNRGLQLIFKTENDSPACVTSQTATKLIQSGWAENHIGVDALGYPPVQLFNVTISPQSIILGMPFYVNAIVVNHQTDPITYYGGCAYPLSVSFNNIKTYTGSIHCLAISKNVLGPNEQAIIHSERIGTLYDATGPDTTTATIKFSYEVNGNQTSFFTSKQFSIQHEQTAPEKSGEANQIK